MKKLLNTLYVTKQGAYLRKDGETVVVEFDKSVLMRLPIHTLSGIVVFGNVMMSPFLLGLCGERGVQVSMLTEQGKFLARFEGPVSGNVLLRITQMQASMDPGKSAALARSFIVGKVMNARNLLERRLRDRGEDEPCRVASVVHANLLYRLRVTNAGTEVLRGIEGEAASSYFSAFNSLVGAEKTAFHISGRNRRPPKDPMNALLSFLYTLLAHDCEGALSSVGLDPQVGFLHAVRPGRPSLALDLMEELRPVLADREALALVNLGKVSVRGFRTTESGAVVMDDDTRKTVLMSWQTRKKELVQHPFLEEKVEFGLLPHVQAMLLARHLRGDLDAYPPFLLK